MTPNDLENITTTIAEYTLDTKQSTQNPFAFSKGKLTDEGLTRFKTFQLDDEQGWQFLKNHKLPLGSADVCANKATDTLKQNVVLNFQKQR